MFRFIRSKLIRSSKHLPNKAENTTKENKHIYNDIEKNLQYIKDQIGTNSDLVYRKIPLSAADCRFGYIIYFKSCIDTESLDKNFLMPVMQPIKKLDLENILKNIPLPQVEQITDLNKCIEEICKGKMLFLVENITSGFLFTIVNTSQRALEESDTEKAMRGSKESFNEIIDTNIFLIRRRLQDPKFTVEEKQVGLRTKTRVAILYIKDITNIDILEELKKRIDKIEVDGITASGMLEQFIEDSPISIFPQIQNTERPERVVESLLEGRVCLLCNGTPVAMLLPTVFLHFLSAAEDYYERTYVGSFNRLLRYIAVFATITFPSIYIALTSFHPQLIPFNLIMTLAESRKEIPFPPLVEALILEITVEFLREMGVRLPQSIGSTLGVVGGIVLGDAAIRANLVSPTMVIVVGATAIISFTIPSFSMVLALRLLRFFVMFMAGLFGAYGIAISWIIILTHLMRLESFSIPYLSPFAPMREGDIKDTFFRTFLWKMKYRPKFAHTQDDKRQSSNKGEKTKNE